ncbi:MAG: 3-deoxy-8-phosphooctulonate synthase [Bacteroidales bacterium]|nr:3-deoxy-8-phosphooctulonate synthase [Bacteroidales bacterium]
MLENLPYVKHTESGQFFLIAGPCVVEDEALCFQVAERVAGICDKLEIPYIFKASYRKANRSRSDSFTGIGDLAALDILRKVRNRLKIPVITDIHAPEEAAIAAEYVDILQIPAFLSRQTDLLIAAAETGKFVNIKKGQFMAPASMKFAVEKVAAQGNRKILLTDRGTMFGYGDLIVDFRGIIEMQHTGYPVVLDITHSLQQPNQESGVSGGLPEMIETLARAGIAAGADGIFLETHPDPVIALSDGANMLELSGIENLLQKLKLLRETVNKLKNQ